MAVISAVAGIINGMFGTGGGIVIIFILNFILKKEDNYEGNNEIFKNIMVMTMLSVLPMSIISALIYWINDVNNLNSIILFLPGAVIGGICGAFLMYKFNVKIIKNIFAATVIYAGIKMFFK